MEIKRTRQYAWKTPALPAVRDWIESYYVKALQDATTAQLRQQVKNTFSDIPDSYIWSEYVKPVSEIDNTYLSCFSVIRRGFAVADAILAVTNFSRVINYFNIKIVRIATYGQLFSHIQANPERCLYYVEEGVGKYGIIVDESLPEYDCAKNIQHSLQDVTFDIAVNFSDVELSVETPHVGEVTLSWPGFETVTLEALPLNEINNLVRD